SRPPTSAASSCRPRTVSRFTTARSGRARPRDRSRSSVRPGEPSRAPGPMAARARRGRALDRRTGRAAHRARTIAGWPGDVLVGRLRGERRAAPSHAGRRPAIPPLGPSRSDRAGDPGGGAAVRRPVVFLASRRQGSPARGGAAREAERGLVDARERLWRRWVSRHPPGRSREADLALPLAPPSPTALPFRAPHLVEALLRTRRGAETEIWSTIDPRLQSTVERMIARYVETQRPLGIRNAAALLVDTRTMAVKALVGSADYFDDEIDGQVNGVFAKRSPGS